MDKIDFIMLWVDDNDPMWQESYCKYAKETYGKTKSPRFRDWGTLKYWFRGVEKYAPWVNKIFFITCGHYPQWLNINHSKIRFLKHEDYIPQEYLPTFNSHTIELNFNRIEELSEKFVYFNDDTFIINKVMPNRFFRNGLPCDMGVLNGIQPHFDSLGYILNNDVSFINKYCNKKESLRKNFSKWFTPKYGFKLLRTIALSGYERYTGFMDPHLPNSFLKRTLQEVWNTNDPILDLTCQSRFRNYNNINQYVFRYWQLTNGNFFPIDVSKDSYSFSEMNDEIFEYAIKMILERGKDIVCINDGNLGDFESCKQRLINAFETILPEKSTFEI